LRLADVVQHVAGSCLLRAVHAQAIVVLDLDVRTHVLALERLALWQPLGQVLVALGLIDVVRDAEKLRAGETGKPLARVVEESRDGGAYSLAKASRWLAVHRRARETQASFCDDVSEAHNSAEGRETY